MFVVWRRKPALCSPQVRFKAPNELLGFTTAMVQARTSGIPIRVRMSGQCSERKWGHDVSHTSV